MFHARRSASSTNPWSANEQPLYACRYWSSAEDDICFSAETRPSSCTDVDRDLNPLTSGDAMSRRRRQPGIRNNTSSLRSHPSRRQVGHARPTIRLSDHARPACRTLRAECVIPHWMLARPNNVTHSLNLMGPMKFNAIYGIALTAMLFDPSMAVAQNNIGKELFLARCAMCHGADATGTGPLARKSNPPTPDLTSAAFKARLKNYPGVIVSSIILRPNGNLIPNTLRDNGIKLPAHTWTDKELRAINDYMTHLVSKN